MKKLRFFTALCCAAAVFAACEKDEAVTGTANGYDWVDLGLPSGTKWATCNIGADAPEGYGNYYAWGETESKSNYSWSTYKYGSAQDALTKYCTDSIYGKDGFTDGLTTLEATDDAATANWGEEWRMPTDAEWTELREKCDWTWTTLNGVKGYKVKATNGGTIFLPAAGCRDLGSLFNAGVNGYYWSSSLSADAPGSAWYAYFYSDNVGRKNYDRCYGRSVRPVLK